MIRRGLDYIASLGVDAIWLSPFFKSPMKDYGYDVSDYRDVDPMFGTLADFDAMLHEAHARGLKVIIDQVWSHTSDKHPWFVESSASRDNPRADWYVWADPRPDGTPPNNWLASFGGPAWTWSARRRQYYLHNFLPEQPDLNFWNPEVQDAVLDTGKFWLDRGVDGFRLDVVNYYFHDRELRDNPPARRNRVPLMATDMQFHRMDRSRPENLAFIARAARPDGQLSATRMTVGEIGDEPPLPRQQEYTEPGRLHTAYSFYLLSGAAGHAGPVPLGAGGVGERARLAVVVARQSRRDALPDPHGAQRPAHGPRAAGGADGDARHGVPLPGRRARPARRPRAVRAAEGPVRDRRLRRRARPRRGAHARCHGPAPRRWAASPPRRTPGCRWIRRTCRWRSSARRPATIRCCTSPAG